MLKKRDKKIWKECFIIKSHLIYQNSLRLNKSINIIMTYWPIILRFKEIKSFL